MNNKILIIDDEPSIRMLVGRILELEGYEVLKAKDRLSACEILNHHAPQVVLCDVFLPDGNGVEMIPQLQRLAPQAKIILLTAHGNITDGVQAIKNGAFDYITKGDDNLKLLPVVSRAMDAASKEQKNQVKNGAYHQPTKPLFTFDDIVGESASLTSVVAQARKVAPTDVPVMINGETGTGKELFASSIHAESLRKDKPFLALNCSAFSRELLESELFGYKAGAFTGAVKDKKGLLEEANHGTIFLDEIGEMAVELQTKLLRVIETGEYIRVGDTKTQKVDVRVISATNRNLKDEIARGNFRNDLYYRLSVFRLLLPPLRDRYGDIPLLANFFLSKHRGRIGENVSGISQDCIEALTRYAWPGNIRELQNAIEHALIVCNGTITANDLPIDIIASEEGDSSLAFDLPTVERNHITKVLCHTNGNKSEAARLLKIGLTTLYRKIEEYKIEV